MIMCINFGWEIDDRHFVLNTKLKENEQVS